MAPILGNLHSTANNAPSLYDHSVDYRLGLEPIEFSYIEISPNPNSESTIREGWLYPHQIEHWLFRHDHAAYDHKFGVQDTQFTQHSIPKGSLRLLLATSKTSNADKRVIIPWSHTTFERICRKWSASHHTVDILTHNTPHVAHVPVECSVGGTDAIESDGM